MYSMCPCHPPAHGRESIMNVLFGSSVTTAERALEWTGTIWNVLWTCEPAGIKHACALQSMLAQLLYVLSTGGIVAVDAGSNG